MADPTNPHSKPDNQEANGVDRPGDSLFASSALPPQEPLVLEPTDDHVPDPDGPSEPAAKGPKRPITEAQAKARAENGRRHSTGPKTPEGKARSSQNATKHGGYALTPVIKHGPLAEDPEALDEFVESMVLSMGVEGFEEIELGRDIAFILWRLRRPQAYEAALIAEKSAGESSFELGACRRQVRRLAGAIEVLTDPDGSHTDDQFEGALIECGHVIGLFMEDDWPNPRPRTSAGWNELIDQTLLNAGSTRPEAISAIEQSLAAVRADLHELALREIGVAAASVIEEDLLLKIVRVEGHLGRELSRRYDLLHAVQRRRRALEGEG